MNALKKNNMNKFIEEKWKVNKLLLRQHNTTQVPLIRDSSSFSILIETPLTQLVHKKRHEAQHFPQNPSN
jgi:hypothetical protein